MKCSNCGANLQIDFAVCPYCGTPNKVAQKHREDMLKYEKDYDNTKRQVIIKSRLVNDKAIRITLIALTIAAVAILIPYAATADSLRRSHERKALKKTVENYFPQIDEYIEEEDYLALNEFSKSHQIERSLPYDNEYYNLVYATAAYSDMLASIMVIKGSNGVDIERYSSNISGNMKIIETRFGKDRVIPNNADDYADHMKRDARLLLKYYLGITEEEYEEMLNMTDTKRNAEILEVVNEIRKEK